eukprot:gene14544-17187_t
MSQEIQSIEEFNNVLNNNRYVVIDFWADWSKPCTQMNQIFDQVEAEKIAEVSLKFDIKSVPSFFFVKDKVTVESIVGADPAALTMKTLQFHTKAASDTTTTTSSTQTAAAPIELSPEVLEKMKQQQEEEKKALTARLEALVNKESVMLFMKGTPEAPQCGFSSKTVALLNKDGFKFGSFNILEDTTVRNGLKEYSNWPTYPQLYISGKLVGGYDIIKELAEDDELAALKP